MDMGTMKRFLIALALFLLPTCASAQCNGVFAANNVCGSIAGGIPGPTAVSGFTLNQTASGFFFAPSANIQRLNDRVFIAGATLNNGTNVTSQPDWLTTWQQARGATFGYIETSQSAILNSTDPHALESLTVGAQSLNNVTSGNAIGIASFGVNNSPSNTVTGFGFYGEGHRCSTCPGGATGIEVDPVNFNSSTVTINPYTQLSGQSIGVQVASGADVYTSIFPATAGVNIRNNGSTFESGIIFGATAIAGTIGNDGSQGEAISMATGHTINYYYGSGNVSWQLYAAPNASGNYMITTQGTGSVSVPALLETTGNAYTTYTPTITAGSGTFTTVSATGRSRQLGKTIFFEIAVTITTNGSAAGNVVATLPFTVGSAIYTAAGRETSVGKMLSGTMASGGTTIGIANYDNTYPGGSGTTLVISGTYERN
jgi:hypothetical protein